MAYHPRDRGVRALIMYTVALNGIGQTISVSPLHMAQAVSSISTGTRVFAHLLSGWGDRELPAPEPVTLPVDPGVLRYLHDGMKAVPEVGTAPRTFSRPLACRMYGKTGTAEIDASRSYNTGWFVGWREPIDESETRMSFACMMTHATGGMRFGGSSCAPVIGTIMEALEERRVAAASSDGGAGE
jgi:cell division protein FtsI/penicillin-binding protein 2